MSKVNIFNKGKRDFTVVAAVVDSKTGKETTPAVVLSPGGTVTVDAALATKLKKVYKDEIVAPVADEDAVDQSVEIAELKGRIVELEADVEGHKAKVEELETDLADATAPTPATPATTPVTAPTPAAPKAAPKAKTTK